jgi:Domain of unknown function (DUF4351)
MYSFDKPKDKKKVDKIKPKQQKEQVMQMVTSWMEKGIEQGIEQGEKQAILRSLQRILLKRLGLIAPEVDQQLQSLSISQLETLLDAAIDFHEQSELLTWLIQH